MSALRNVLLVVPVAAIGVFGLSRLTSASGATAGRPLPFAESPYVLGDEIEHYADFMMSGGPPPDGIPSIDEPRFIGAGEAQLLPALTILISPLNILIGLVLAVLAGLNLTVTWMAVRQPKACRFNRSTGILASFPALLAGSACCAPAIVLILGLQMSSLFVTVFQVLIPVSVGLLLVTLAMILHRTDTDLIAAAQ